MIKDVEKKQGRCPNCGSGNLKYGDLEYGDFGDTVYYEFECENCGKRGREWYELQYVGSEIIEED